MYTSVYYRKMLTTDVVMQREKKWNQWANYIYNVPIFFYHFFSLATCEIDIYTVYTYCTCTYCLPCLSLFIFPFCRIDFSLECRKCHADTSIKNQKSTKCWKIHISIHVARWKHWKTSHHTVPQGQAKSALHHLSHDSFPMTVRREIKTQFNKKGHRMMQ